MAEEISEVERDMYAKAPFDVSILDNIYFSGNGQIIIDSKFLTKLNLQNILERSEILRPSDLPRRIITFADKTEHECRIGILADMGNHDTAGLYLTKPTSDYDP
jgi:hypothetical protein